MLLSSLALVFLPIILAANPPRTCLPSGDEKAINEELSKGACSSLKSRRLPDESHNLQEVLTLS